LNTSFAAAGLPNQRISGDGQASDTGSSVKAPAMRRGASSGMPISGVVPLLPGLAI
jgi:hypothetical protein